MCKSTFTIMNIQRFHVNKCGHGARLIEQYIFFEMNSK